jgi:chromosome segregation ATPase
MQKELNPSLFPNLKNRKDANGESLPALEVIYEKALAASEEVRLLRTQLNRLQDQMTRMGTHLTENTKSQQVKFDRLGQSLTRIDQNHSEMIREINEKLALVNSKLAERKTFDFKSQEVIEQQSQMLKSYEARIVKLQKILSEKEAQISTMAGFLNEAKMELSRLKR